MIYLLALWLSTQPVRLNDAMRYIGDEHSTKVCDQITPYGQPLDRADTLAEMKTVEYCVTHPNDLSQECAE